MTTSEQENETTLTTEAMMPKTTVVESEQEQGGTATMDPSAEQQPASQPKHEQHGDTFKVPIKLGKVSGGKGKVSTRVDMPREALSPDQADKHLVRSQINVSVELDEDQADQLTIEQVKPTFNGSADVTTISIDSDHLSFTLGFNAKSIDDQQYIALRRLAQQECIMRFRRTGAASPEAASDDDDGATTNEPESGKLFDGNNGVEADKAPAGRDAWRDVAIGELERYGAKSASVKKLKEKGITTLGKLATFTEGARGLTWFQDVPGIGEAAAGQISDAVNAFGVKNKHLYQDAPADSADATLITWLEKESSSHIAFAYSQYRDAEGADGYGYCIDKANGQFVLGGDREVVAEETEHATVEDAKAAAESLEREHLAAADDTPNSEAA